MSLKKDPITCRHCGTVRRVPHSSRGFYCSNACQQAYAFAVRYTAWVQNGGEHDPRFLRRLLLERDGHQCGVCKRKTWCEAPIPLELDHADGDYTNDSPANLRLICPNCHAQTSTYKNRNKGAGRPWRRK